MDSKIIKFKYNPLNKKGENKMEKRTFKRGMKLVSLLSAVALMAGCMAGCGNDAATTDDQGRTIVSVGGWPTKEGKGKENMEARKARFEEANKEDRKSVV